MHRLEDEYPHLAHESCLLRNLTFQCLVPCPLCQVPCGGREVHTPHEIHYCANWDRCPRGTVFTGCAHMQQLCPDMSPEVTYKTISQYRKLRENVDRVRRELNPEPELDYGKESSKLPCYFETETEKYQLPCTRCVLGLDRPCNPCFCYCGFKHGAPIVTSASAMSAFPLYRAEHGEEKAHMSRRDREAAGLMPCFSKEIKRRGRASRVVFLSETNETYPYRGGNLILLILVGMIAMSNGMEVTQFNSAPAALLGFLGTLCTAAWYTTTASVLTSIGQAVPEVVGTLTVSFERLLDELVVDSQLLVQSLTYGIISLGTVLAISVVGLLCLWTPWMSDTLLQN